MIQTKMINRALGPRGLDVKNRAFEPLLKMAQRAPVSQVIGNYVISYYLVTSYYVAFNWSF